MSSDFRVERPLGLGGLTQMTASQAGRKAGRTWARAESCSADRCRVSRCWPLSGLGPGPGQGLASAEQARRASWAHRGVWTAARGLECRAQGTEGPTGQVKSKACCLRV